MMPSHTSTPTICTLANPLSLLYPTYNTEEAQLRYILAIVDVGGRGTWALGYGGLLALKPKDFRRKVQLPGWLGLASDAACMQPPNSITIEARDLQIVRVFMVPPGAYKYCTYVGRPVEQCSNSIDLCILYIVFTTRLPL